MPSVVGMSYSGGGGGPKKYFPGAQPGSFLVALWALRDVMQNSTIGQGTGCYYIGRECFTLCSVLLNIRDFAKYHQM